MSRWEALPGGSTGLLRWQYPGFLYGQQHENRAVCTGPRERLPQHGYRGAILHSDRGSQFTSQVFLTALRRHKLIQSMSGTGRCYDNARMESFFATLKKEKLYQIDTTRMSRDEVKSVVFRYIRYYNLRRISSVTGGLPPLVYRERYLRSEVKTPTR